MVTPTWTARVGDVNVKALLNVDGKGGGTWKHAPWIRWFCGLVG